jgi:acetolactate synthase-1/3 small subunit
MRHIISVLVENRSGVLARVAGLFSARGFNIDSLAVGETEDPTVSRMTIVVKGDDKTLEQVKKQLNKLIDVISVKDLRKKDFIDRELVLFKVSVSAADKSKVVNFLEKNHAKVLHY